MHRYKCKLYSIAYDSYMQILSAFMPCARDIIVEIYIFFFTILERFLNQFNMKDIKNTCIFNSLFLIRLFKSKCAIVY